MFWTLGSLYLEEFVSSKRKQNSAELRGNVEAAIHLGSLEQVSKQVQKPSMSYVLRNKRGF